MNRSVWLMLGLCLSAVSLCFADPETDEDIRAHIASIANRSVTSSSGHFVIVGTNKLENLRLAGFCEDVSDRIASITGLSVPYDNRTIYVTILDGGVSAEGGALVRHGGNSDSTFHNVDLDSYETAYSRRGRQALCHVVMAGYVNPSLQAMLRMPPWLWKGVEQTLDALQWAVVIERVLSLWQQGKLPSVLLIVGSGDGLDPRSKNIEEHDQLVAYGAFVRWFAALPDRKMRFQAVFDRVQSGEPVNVAFLQSLVASGSKVYSIDDSLDLWLMQQRQVVHALGLLSTRIMDQLCAELLIYPGACDIPHSIDIPAGSGMSALIPFKRSEWIESFVRSKRRRLELLKAGRSKSFRTVVDRYFAFLAALESQVSDRKLEILREDAEAALLELNKRVEAAGGILLEQDLLNDN
jgi:hypothetical protein